MKFLGTLRIRLFEEENCLYWNEETFKVRTNEMEEVEGYIHEIRKYLPHSIDLDKIEFKFSFRTIREKNLLFVFFYINGERWFKSKRHSDNEKNNAVIKNLFNLQNIFVLKLWTKKILD